MSTSELISTLYALTLQKWMGVAMDALVIFEYATTLDHEISLVWQRKLTGASILFVTTRWIMLAGAIYDLALLGPLNSQDCTKTSFVSASIILVSGFVVAAAFSALRVYALCGRNIVLSAIVFLLQLSPVVVNIYNETQSMYVLDPVFGCVDISRFSSKTQEVLTLAARIPITVGDTLVVIITWGKSLGHLKLQCSLGANLALSTVLFRDEAGSTEARDKRIHRILLVLNILETCPLTSSRAGLIIGSLSGALPSILINRFILNLHRLSNPEARSTSQACTFSTPIYGVDVNISGNMGESLEWGCETGNRDDAEADEIRHSAGDAGPSGQNA